MVVSTSCLYWQEPPYMSTEFYVTNQIEGGLIIKVKRSKHERTVYKCWLCWTVTQYVSIEMKLTVLFIRTGITYVFSVLMVEIAYLVFRETTLLCLRWLNELIRYYKVKSTQGYFRYNTQTLSTICVLIYTLYSVFVVAAWCIGYAWLLIGQSLVQTPSKVNVVSLRKKLIA